MAHSRPLMDNIHLPEAAVHELEINHAGDVDFMVERPAGEGLPEVIWILDDDEEEVPQVQAQVGIPEGFIAPLYSDDEDENESEYEESEESETEDSEDEDSSLLWTSEDSGYESMYDSEDEEEEDDRSLSPLDQELPAHFHQRWQRPSPLLLPGPCALPQLLNVGRPQAAEDPPQPTGSEECAPSCSDLSSSTKRSREEIIGEQVSAKRPRWDCEESHEESAPSTSVLHTSTTRSEEDEDYRYSAPSTSGSYRRGPVEYRFMVMDDSDSD